MNGDVAPVSSSSPMGLTFVDGSLFFIEGTGSGPTFVISVFKTDGTAQER